MKNQKGYLVPAGYMGWVEEEQAWRLFATEAEYEEEVLDEQG